MKIIIAITTIIITIDGDGGGSISYHQVFKVDRGGKGPTPTDKNDDDELRCTVHSLFIVFEDITNARLDQASEKALRDDYGR